MVEGVKEVLGLKLEAAGVMQIYRRLDPQETGRIRLRDFSGLVEDYTNKVSRKMGGAAEAWALSMGVSEVNGLSETMPFLN